ncbi:acyltransferase domain-containing protein, partial [Microbispora sp. NPDC049125]|uniref:acyltransferase domain-containing protein n=1 Tax=Microbispora sp. NPDC049125 TaxID=3154929 RepID=UPI0034654879
MLSGRGAMASIALPADRVRDLLSGQADAGDASAGGGLSGVAGRVSVAVVNSPSATVVAGEVDAVEELLAWCGRRGVRAKRVPVDYASHCAQVEVIEDELGRLLEGVVPRRGEVPFYSTVTGGLVDHLELGAGYWYRNLREPVAFEQTVRVLAEQGHTAFIEMSPHPVLTMAVQETLDAHHTTTTQATTAANTTPGKATAVGTPEALAPVMSPVAVVVGSLRRDDGGLDRFLTSLAEAHVQGIEVDWTGLFPGGRRVELPTYAFQREHFWPESSGWSGSEPGASAGAGVLGDGEFWAAVDSGDVEAVAAAVGAGGGDRSWLA